MISWLDNAGGVLFGGLKAAIIISSLLPLFMFLPQSFKFVQDTRENSIVFRYLQGFAPQVYQYLLENVPGAESFNENDHILDYPRVKEIFKEGAEKTSTEIIHHLDNAGEKWRNGIQQNDDITFIAFKFNK